MRLASGRSDARTRINACLLLAILDGEVKLPLSPPPLLLEYEAVLTRPAVPGMAEEVLTVLDELAGLCAPVALNYHWRP